MSRLSVFSGAILAAFCLSSLAWPARGESVFEAISREVQVVYAQHQSAIVRIQAEDEHGRLSGSGFYIDPNGTIFTSYTIGGDTRNIVVCSGDSKLPAERLVGDARSGIAILKVKARTPFLVIGKSADLSVASPVIVIGYPMDLPATPTFGAVGGFDVKYLGRYLSPAYIRANVPVERGEGGAPLLNLKGEAVGILISPRENGTGCFALPIEAAEKVHADFLRFGEARPGWLGITVGKAPRDEEGPPEVREVIPDSPAAKSGLQKGDLLLGIGEKRIHSPEDVLDASFYLTAGDEVPLLVSRDGKETTLQARAVGIPAPLDALRILKDFAAHPGVSPVETIWKVNK